MKFFLSIVTCFIFSIGVLVAQPTKKAVIQTPTLQCDACKSRIENRLMREEGIASVKADPKKHNVTVVYITDRTNIENIKTAIANLGYDADDVSAEPDAYTRLPATCRHIAKK
jgi:mercuric ion binding protein